MTVLLLFILTIDLLLVAPAWFYARGRSRWFAWDYALLVAPVGLWIGLTVAGIGPQSLSNIIELFMVAAAVPILLYVRLFVIDRLSENHRTNSFAVLMSCLAFALILRLAMPLLPE